MRSALISVKGWSLSASESSLLYLIMLKPFLTENQVELDAKNGNVGMLPPLDTPSGY